MKEPVENTLKILLLSTIPLLNSHSYRAHTHTHTQRKRFINNDESYEYGKSSPLGSLSSLLITALQVCVSSIFKIPLDVLS